MPFFKFSPKTSNTRAQNLHALQTPGNPLILTNVHDGESAKIALRNGAKAIATSSYAVAAVRGKRDEELTIEELVSSTRDIMGVISQNTPGVEVPVPLSVDMRDGFGEELESVVSALIAAGAVGCNIEDEDAGTGQLISSEDAAARVRRVLAEAERMGVPDFAVNARTDVLLHDGSIDDAISRGQTYLSAGATTVFVWGNQRGVSSKEVRLLVDAFQGRLNVRMMLKPGFLGVEEVSELGVARVSVGRELHRVAMEAYEEAVSRLLD